MTSDEHHQHCHLIWVGKGGPEKINHISHPEVDIKEPLYHNDDKKMPDAEMKNYDK